MKRKILAALGLGLTAALVVPAVAPAGAATRPTLAQILLADSKFDAKNGFDANPHDLDIVTQAVLAFPTLTAAASNPAANLTVFLPTDYAFRKLVRDLTGKTIYKESEIFAAVVGLGLPTVEKVLTYHILSGARIDYATALKSDGADLTMLSTDTLTVDVRGTFFKRIFLVDKDPDLRDAKVVAANVRASNGIAHVIDRVLLPFNV
jgi:uncharacterized surface protein with fasciclin (FAS1) repeats